MEDIDALTAVNIFITGILFIGILLVGDVVKLIATYIETTTLGERIITGIIFISVISIFVPMYEAPKYIKSTKSIISTNDINITEINQSVESVNIDIFYDNSISYKPIDLDLLSSIEGGVDYTTVNTGSGAFGRWQLLVKTASSIAKRLSIPLKDIKLPKNQIAIATYLRQQNYFHIIRNGYAPTDYVQYIYWQQGVGGGTHIMNLLGKNKPIPINIVKNMLYNMPYSKPYGKKSGRTKFTSIEQWFNDWRDIVEYKTQKLKVDK